MQTFKLQEPLPENVLPPTSEPEVRVAVVLEDDGKTELSFSPLSDYEIDGEILKAGESYKIAIEGDKCRLVSTDKVASILRLIPKGEKGITLHGIRAGRGFHWQKEISETFLGEMEFRYSEGKILVINIIGMEQYVACVLASEMSGKNSLPAFAMAQATAARSWAYAFLNTKYPDKPYHICNDDMSQRYQGITHISKEVFNAVKECSGDYLVMENGYVAPAFYSKSCGGYIEPMQNIFGVDDGLTTGLSDSNEETNSDFEHTDFAAFLQSTSDAFCSVVSDKDAPKYLGAVDEGGTYFRWSHITKAETVLENLKKKCGINDAVSILDIEFGRRGGSGRYLDALLTYADRKGEKHTIKLADQFYIRSVLHESFLYSSAFECQIERETSGEIKAFHFYGAGWGHGVGLCQIGAVGMALKGHSYHEILKHYYPNFKVVKVY